MNYILKKNPDGTKFWAQIIYNEETKKFEYDPIEGSITLDPNTYYERDEITINSNAPPDLDDCMPLEDLWKKLEEEFKNKPIKEFKPYIRYCNDTPGQAVEAILTGEHHLAKWINPYLTVYYLPEQPEKIVGFRIEGLTRLRVKGSHS